MIHEALRVMNDNVFREQFGDRPAHKNIALIVTDFKATNHNGQQTGTKEAEEMVKQVENAEKRGITILAGEEVFMTK